VVAFDTPKGCKNGEYAEFEIELKKDGYELVKIQESSKLKLWRHLDDDFKKKWIFKKARRFGLLNLNLNLEFWRENDREKKPGEKPVLRNLETDRDLYTSPITFYPSGKIANEAKKNKTDLTLSAGVFTSIRISSEETENVFLPVVYPRNKEKMFMKIANPPDSKGLLTQGLYLKWELAVLVDVKGWYGLQILEEDDAKRVHASSELLGQLAKAA